MRNNAIQSLEFHKNLESIYKYTHIKNLDAYWWSLYVPISQKSMAS